MLVLWKTILTLLYCFAMLAPNVQKEEIAMTNGNEKILGGEEYFANHTVKDSTEEVMRVLSQYEYSVAIGMNSEGYMELFIGGTDNQLEGRTVGVCVLGMIQWIREHGNELTVQSLMDSLDEMRAVPNE